MNSPATKKNIDFERLGYETMLETGDEIAAQHICGLKIQALEDEIQPELAHVEAELSQARARAAALHSWLYDRVQPISAAAMLARTVGVNILLGVVMVVCLASVVSHIVTFTLFGFPLTLGILLGLTVTGIVAACGYQLFDKILAHQKALEAVIICASFAMCYWGLVELNQARSLMVNKASSEASASIAASSYVDDAPADSSSDEPAGQSHSDEQTTQGLLGDAVLKIMLAADALLGILLGIVLRAKQDETYVAWHALRKLSKHVPELNRHRNELLSVTVIAKKRCMAGILRAKHTTRTRTAPYHMLPLAMLVMLLMISLPAHSQSVSRHEGILLDVSGSIGGADRDLFREYLVSINGLLVTEPPNSHVWVSVISTDSFGSVRELVRGWTPDGHGVFTDDLNRARHQLVSKFQSQAAGLAPVASGTDIIGGLWHLKALVESGPASEHVAKDIWIFSDMMNETAELPMPALIPSGPDGMLKRAKSNRLIVPLAGYRIHVLGASPSGMSPYEWNTVKTFWRLYFQAAGAELVSYSAEARCERE